ncbi:MAG: DNA glycosylase [Clostridia bacterium]|nr:DNA glycosylase [Clostridia bacterium]
MRHTIHIPLPDFDARATLMDSAQCFCWHDSAEGLLAALDDGFGTAAFCVSEGQDGISIRCERPLNEAFWRNYFDAERDYSRLVEQFGWHEQMAAALRAARGLRVLRQPAWDALLSFILSANNNVGRIRSLVEKLSVAYGTAARWEGQTLHAIPTAAQLSRATEAELRALGCGYRAPFLVDTAARVAGGFDLDGLRSAPYAEAHAALTSLKGVGDKVADCVCLFGLQHVCAFPVDVWVERLLIAWFGMEGLSRRQMARRAEELLGDEAGLIQQYLFHCARLGLLDLSKKTSV